MSNSAVQPLQARSYYYQQVVHVAGDGARTDCCVSFKSGVCSVDHGHGPWDIYPGAGFAATSNRRVNDIHISDYALGCDVVKAVTVLHSLSVCVIHGTRASIVFLVLQLVALRRGLDLRNPCARCTCSLQDLWRVVLAACRTRHFASRANTGKGSNLASRMANGELCSPRGV